VGDDPTARLRAVCHAYVSRAITHPYRYAAMFARTPEDQVHPSALPPGGPLPLGGEAFDVLVAVLAACNRSGASHGGDPVRDATALWTALHGYASLRPATPGFPWSNDLVDLLIERVALVEPTR
jgi:hypothetical protein